MTADFVTRFAPSPTGALHLGHAFSALTAWDAAQAAGGAWLLRLEDIDADRCRPAYEADLLTDLAWLGLSWPTPVRRQSTRLAVYEATLMNLAQQGLVYRCFKTRKDIAEQSTAAPHGPEAAYQGAALAPAREAQLIAQGAGFAWRLSLAACAGSLGKRWGRLSFDADGRREIADPSRLGDVILGRKAFPASYHLASVLDDADQGVSDIIRGEDLADAAHLHVVLQALLDLPTPRYRHHRLILGEDGKRLAKRNKAATLQDLRAAGVTPMDLRARVGL